jgi:hypothetical protein
VFRGLRAAVGSIAAPSANKGRQAMAWQPGIRAWGRPRSGKGPGKRPRSGRPCLRSVGLRPRTFVRKNRG